MSLRYVDNFSFWVTPPGTFQSASNIVITGGILEMTMNAGNAIVTNGLTAQATYIINTRTNLFGVNAARLHSLKSTLGGEQCTLATTPLGKLYFQTGFGGGGPAIGPVSVNSLTYDAGVTYYDIETKVTISNTGSVELRVNGGVQIPPTVGDTQGGSTSDADIAYPAWDFSTAPGTVRMEHAIVMDSTGSVCNNFLGPVNVEFLPPTGDGFYTDWSVTNPPNVRWQAVDDSDPDEDATYIYDNVVGDKNTFTHGTLSGGNTAVRGAAIWTRARRDDATTRAFKNLIRSGGTDNLGSTEHFVGDDYIWFFQGYDQNPITAAPFTVSQINSLDYGIELTT